MPEPPGPHGRHLTEGLEVEHNETRMSEARQRRRGLAGDSGLAVIGALIAGAFVVGIGWRLLSVVF